MNGSDSKLLKEQLSPCYGRLNAMKETHQIVNAGVLTIVVGAFRVRTHTGIGATGRVCIYFKEARRGIFAVRVGRGVVHTLVQCGIAIHSDDTGLSAFCDIV